MSASKLTKDRKAYALLQLVSTVASELAEAIKDGRDFSINVTREMTKLDQKESEAKVRKAEPSTHRHRS